MCRWSFPVRIIAQVMLLAGHVLADSYHLAEFEVSKEDDSYRIVSYRPHTPMLDATSS